jgi:hypothetical protein
MFDVSNDQPMEAFDRGNPARRCTAHRKNGEQCRKWAIRGASVCGTHGGRAPQVKAKARQRLEEAADRMAKALLGMATDENVADAVKLAAIRDALSRAGITEKTAVEVEVALKPWERVMEDVAATVEAGSRAAYRASIGQPDPLAPALADRAQPDDDGTIYAEIVDPNGGADLIAAMATTRVNDDGHPTPTDDDQHAPTARTAPGTGQSGGSAGLVPFEVALEQAAAIRRQQAAHVHPMRALPPGRG